MEKSKLKFIPAQQNDIKYLLDLRINTMNEHLINSEMDIDVKNHIKRIKYKWDDLKIILLNNNRIGMLKVFEDDLNIEIIQIQIDPKYQNFGTGEQIIRLKIKEVIKKRKSLIVSVLKQNKAKKLYDKLGFKVIEENDSSYLMKYQYS